MTKIEAMSNIMISLYDFCKSAASNRWPVMSPKGWQWEDMGPDPLISWGVSLHLDSHVVIIFGGVLKGVVFQSFIYILLQELDDDTTYR